MITTKSDAAASAKFLSFLIIVAGTTGWVSNVQANGLERNGVGARSMGIGGASVADEEDALGAMAYNPAILGFFGKRQVILGVNGVFADGDYTSQAGDTGHLKHTDAVFPDIALILPVSQTVTLGLSVIPDDSRMANWRYVDPVGAAGVGYGLMKHRSEIMDVRGALAAGIRLSDSVSLGVSVGAEYNENHLNCPYIFQSHPGLAGAKTLLDLGTTGWGINADVGLAWKVNDKVTLGLGYRSPTKFNTDGSGHGDATAQLAALGVPSPNGVFAYDADIDTELPQKISAGFALKASKQWRVYGQVEWVNWADAFDDLTVKLSNGNNGTINGILGSDVLVDTIPLDWKDRFVFRLGTEYDVCENVTLRAGYSYGKSPVPGSTVLPLTAAISEHTVSAGVGWHKGPWTVDFTWQYDLPAGQNAGADGIAGTEYDFSHVELSAHWISVTAGYRF
jgi:long-chain fatty acid transport protein